MDNNPTSNEILWKWNGEIKKQVEELTQENVLLQQEIEQLQRTILYIQKYQIMKHNLNNQIWIVMCLFYDNGSVNIDIH